MDNTLIIETLTRLFKHTPHIQKGGEQAYFFCPSCHHHKRKLNINVLTGYYNCWTCDFKGKSFRSLLKKLHAPNEFYNILCKNEVSRNTYIENKSKVLVLPEEYKPLYVSTNSITQKHALRYCLNRKLSVCDIVRYNIGFCESGKYINRIIIPSYTENGELNFFCGRDIFDSKMKYRLCDSTKNIIGFEQLTNFSQPITLVEGVFDAFSVRYNAVPLFGKTLSDKLKIKLIAYKPPRVNVLLDNDALESSLKICEFLLQNQIDTYLVLLDGKDPNEIGHKKTWQTIEDSARINESSLFTLKMKYNI